MRSVSDYDSIEKRDIPDLVLRARRIIDRFLFQSGEAFASAVVSGFVSSLDVNALKNVIIGDVSEHPPDHRIAASIVDMMIDCVSHIVSSPSEVVRKHLRMLSDSYTLFAFLREVPDVQSATKKIFSYGNIWLDTTIILPVLSESLKEPGENRRFTNILKAVRQSGVSLFMTSGVITEIVSHIHVSVTCAGYNISAWRGRVPYLYYHYVELGYAPSNFKAWVELFRGYERPEDDVADYLSQEYGIQKKDLDEEPQSVDSNLKYAVERLWAEAHEKRRRNRSDEEKDDAITANLVKHDVESYLGIVALRKKEEVSELGFKNWWLTIDHIAWEIRDCPCAFKFDQACSLNFDQELKPPVDGLAVDKCNGM